MNNAKQLCRISKRKCNVIAETLICMVYYIRILDCYVWKAQFSYKTGAEERKAEKEQLQLTQLLQSQ